MRVWRTTLQMIVVALGLSAGLDAAVATPLDQPACEALKTEQTALASAGVEADWQKGSDWGKSNANPDRLKEIERYIAITEQLSFRCRWLPASEQAKRAGEIADKLAKNPDADPLAPQEPQATAGTDAKSSPGKPSDDQPAKTPTASGAGAAAAGAADNTDDKLPIVTRLKKKTRAVKAREAAKAQAAKTAPTGETGDGASASDQTAKVAGKPVKKKAAKEDAYVPPPGIPQSTLSAPEASETKLPWTDQVTPTPVTPSKAPLEFRPE